MQQGFAAGVFRLLIFLLEEIEVAVVIEDQELAFVFARAEQIGAQARATANHLPELDPGFDRFGEYQVDHFRHVDAGVEHVHRDGNAEVVIRFFELFDQGIHVRNGVVDNLANLGAVLRVKLAEEFFQMLGVVLTLGKNDSLADE
ncbi:hypothetical protein D3C73_1250780 [compost metagenome]